MLNSLVGPKIDSTDYTANNYGRSCPTLKKYPIQIISGLSAICGLIEIITGIALITLNDSVAIGSVTIVSGLISITVSGAIYSRINSYFPG